MRSARSRGLRIRVGIALGEHAAAPERLWPAVDAAEDLGYDSIWCSDTASRPGLAPLATLAAVAARTRRLKLGTSVLVVPPRNPVLLAREMATVDVLSEGRLLPAFGLGIDDPVELAALGVQRSQRVARLEEAIEVIGRLWSGAPVDYRGSFTDLRGVSLEPPPTRSRLEIWLGGRAPAALERAGRIAGGWLGSFLSPAELAAATDAIRLAARKAGRAIDEDHFGTTLFAASGEDPRALEDPVLSMRGDLAVADHCARDAEQLAALLERFVEEGASKFVVVPLTDDLPRWLEQMRPAIAAVEGST